MLDQQNDYAGNIENDKKRKRETEAKRKDYGKIESEVWANLDWQKVGPLGLLPRTWHLTLVLPDDLYCSATQNMPIFFRNSQNVIFSS